MKIAFVPRSAVPDDDLARNRVNAKSLGLPFPWAAGAPPLAVVGGGPSVAGSLDELRQWTGEIWAINGAWRYLRNEVIDATFYSLDPAPAVAELCRGAARAVLGVIVHPAVFWVLDRAKISVADNEELWSPTSAATAPVLAGLAGYSRVEFFGCEGSFDTSSHAYQDVPGNRLLVKCDGREFLTSPQMFMQCEALSEIIRALPGYLFDRSGGLLGAMIADPFPDITAASPQIHEALKNGDKDHH